MEKKQYKKQRISTNEIVFIGIMVAANIVLSRFLSINAWNTKIGFAFTTVYAAAYIYGPVAAAITGALGDFIGAICFPIGAYFPGFTLTAALTGILFGFLLKDGYARGTKNFAMRTVIAVLVNQWILGWLINSFWISVLYGASYKALLVTRSVQAGIMTAVEIVVILALGRALKQIKIRKH